jgi:hypothetical protein
MLDSLFWIQQVKDGSHLQSTMHDGSEKSSQLNESNLKVVPQILM